MYITPATSVCVCVCVCVREREREKEIERMCVQGGESGRGKGMYIRTHPISRSLSLFLYYTHVDMYDIANTGYSQSGQCFPKEPNISVQEPNICAKEPQGASCIYIYVYIYILGDL